MYANSPAIEVPLGGAFTIPFVMQPIVDITGWTLQVTVVLYNDPNDPPGPLNPGLLTLTPTITSGPAGTFTQAVTSAQNLLLGRGYFFYSAWRIDPGFEDEIASGNIDNGPTSKRWP